MPPSSLHASSTALVMMDSRDPRAMIKHVESATDASVSGVALSLRISNVSAALTTFFAYYINLQFCRVHNAACLYYRLESGGCDHPRWGARHPSYCKLAAVAHALFGPAAFERVLFLDSDCFWRDTLLSAPRLWRKYGGLQAATSADMIAARDSTIAAFGWDSPYSLGPNGGFFMLRDLGSRARRKRRPSAAMTAKDLLRVWWNIESGPFGAAHPFEQHTLQWQVMHLDSARRHIQTLRVRTMDPNTTDPVVHLDHNAGTKTRNWVMARAVAEWLVAHESGKHESEARRALEMRSNGTLASEAMGELLPLLRRSRQRMPSARRRRALASVVLAAIEDLRRAEASGAFQPMPRSIPLDATRMASRYLRLAPSEEEVLLVGMPLFLANVSRRAAANRDHSLSNDGREGGDRGGGAASDASDWQLWIVDEGNGTAAERAPDAAKTDSSSSSSSSGGMLLRLAARPWLCLTLGPTRAPKAPYVPLAVLGRCDATRAAAAAAAGTALAVDGDGRSTTLGSLRRRMALRANRSSPEAARIAFLHEPSGGTLRTRMRLRTMRKLLPEHNTSCGFWPTCTGIRTVQPKDCWAQLAEDPEACGVSEPTLSNFIRRGAAIRMHDGKLLADAKPGWRTASLGPAGPVPTAMLLAGGADRLCLSRWRSEAVEGSAVAFAACPKQRKRAPRAMAKAAKAAEAGASAAAAAESAALARGEDAASAKAAGRKALEKVARALDVVRVEGTPHAQKWRANDASSWDLLADEHSGPGAPRLVRVVPRQAPGLCLAVPRLSLSNSF